VTLAVLGRKGKPERARSAARHARDPAVAFGRGRGGKGAAIAFVRSDSAVRLKAIRRSGRTRPIESVPAARAGNRVGMNLEFDDAGRPVLAWVERAGVVLAR
jgi:hypothetical protein